jgi:hypothetical protein
LPDVVTANGTSPYSLSVMPNVGGVLQSAIPVSLSGVPGGVAIGDLDGTGLPDVAVSNTTTGGVDLFLNSGAFGLVSGGSIPGGGATGGLTIAELDRNGRPEVVVADSIAGGVWVHGRSAAGSWDTHTFLAAAGATAIVAADLTGDIWPELIVAGGTSNQVHVLRNSSTGFVGAASYPAGSNVRAAT